jgi:phosphatidylinositol phospholipase C delta
MRVDSSNYDPFIPWSFGIQMAAMNFQTPGPPLWAYRGMFKDNGECGYVKKPNCLLSKLPHDLHSLPPECILRVRILSARFMHHRHIQQNFIDVNVFGVGKDTQSFRTEVVKGFDRCTFDQEFAFILRCPSMAVLTLNLGCVDSFVKEGFVGQVAIPINNLNQGRFHIHLRNRQGSRFRGNKRHMGLAIELNLSPVTGNIKKMLQ